MSQIESTDVIVISRGEEVFVQRMDAYKPQIGDTVEAFGFYSSDRFLVYGKTSWELSFAPASESDPEFDELWKNMVASGLAEDGPKMSSLEKMLAGERVLAVLVKHVVPSSESLESFNAEN